MIARTSWRCVAKGVMKAQIGRCPPARGAWSPCGPPQIFGPGGFVEAEVAVQAGAHRVAIQYNDGEAQGAKTSLKGRGKGALSRSRQAVEPDGLAPHCQTRLLRGSRHGSIEGLNRIHALEWGRLGVRGCLAAGSASIDVADGFTAIRRDRSRREPAR